MSETFDGKKDPRGRTLLSLARWSDAEDSERAPVSPGASIADLLRRRGETPGTEHEVPAVEHARPAKPEIAPPPRRADQSHARRRGLPPADREPAFRAPAPVEAPSAGDHDAGPEPRNSAARGLFGSIARLVGRKNAKTGDAEDLPAAPQRSAMLRRGRAPRDVLSVTDKNLPAEDVALAAIGPTPSGGDDLMSVIRRAGNGSASGSATGEHASLPVPASPAAAAPSGYGPLPDYPPGPVYSMPPAPMPAAAPAAPLWPAAMPLPPFYSAMPMAQTSSAHYYWHPVSPPHWAFAAPHVPQARSGPISPPASHGGSDWPNAANDAAPHPTQTHAAYEPDPMTSEIDDVRERLRAFGERLQELRRLRASRQLG